MTVRVAINGFGRTGRCTFRSAQLSGADIEVAAINDVMDTGTLAHLLRRDSVFGRFPAEVAAAGDAMLTVDGGAISVFSESDPAEPPWGELAIDVVIESSGRLRDRHAAGKHLAAGVKVLAWYDNEWGYATRLAELAERVGALAPASV